MSRSSSARFLFTRSSAASRPHVQVFFHAGWSLPAHVAACFVQGDSSSRCMAHKASQTISRRVSRAARLRSEPSSRLP